jgi:hypothetical protein
MKSKVVDGKPANSGVGKEDEVVQWAEKEHLLPAAKFSLNVRKPRSIHV